MTHRPSGLFDAAPAPTGFLPTGGAPAGGAVAEDEPPALPATPGPADAAARAREALNQSCIEWLGRLAAGDADALGPLYHATLPRLWSLATKVLGSDSDAEDVLSEVYTQVWRDARRFDATRGSALAWLSVICRSRAIDCLRRREPTGVVDAAELGLDASGEEADVGGGASTAGAAVADDPLNQLARQRAHRELDGALAELAPADRQLVVLAYYRDMSQSELAQALGLPLGTVKSRTRRVLAELRNMLNTGNQ